MTPQRITRVLMYCVPAFLVGCASGTGAEVDLAAEAEAIRSLDTALTGAAQSGDPEAFSLFFAEDAVQMPPDSPPLKGREAIHGSVAGLMGAGADLRFETREVKVASSGDMAFSRGMYFLTLETPSGTIQDEGSYLEVWEKVGGEWKITRDIYNTDLQPAEPEAGTGS